MLWIYLLLAIELVLYLWLSVDGLFYLFNGDDDLYVFAGCNCVGHERLGFEIGDD